MSFIHILIFVIYIYIYINFPILHSNQKVGSLTKDAPNYMSQ